MRPKAAAVRTPEKSRAYLSSPIRVENDAEGCPAVASLIHVIQVNADCPTSFEPKLPYFQPKFVR